MFGLMTELIMALAWPKVIQDQLDACDAFIVVVSENSYRIRMGAK